MNNIDRQYQSLLTDYSNARKYFLSYIMKVTYGFKQDILHNTKMANHWDNVIKSLEEKIIKYYEYN
jgi:hypothetical protein